MSDQKPQFTLESNSPRRRQLLSEAGYVFDVVPAELAEPDPHVIEQSPVHWAQALSYYKARNVAPQRREGYILAADTVVSLNDQMYGKANDRSHAREILSALMGTTHQVITGVTLFDAATGWRCILHDVDRCDHEAAGG